MSLFADRNLELSRAWRRRVELDGGWRRSASQAGGLLETAVGEAGGFFVELQSVAGRRAYLKPLKRHEWRRAAREKIASDLAFELGVPVPPVLLAVNGQVPDAERWACVSLLLFPHQFSWGQVRSFLADGENPIALELSSLLVQPATRAFAFDTWLGQTDHGDHPSNIVFGYEGREYQSGSFVFLDYAFSMGVSGDWAGDGFRKCGPAPFPPRMCATLSASMLEESITGIESLPDSTLEDIVNRVPWQWLRDDEKQVILAGLSARRALVRNALERYLEANS